jgi:hypothetical protein
MEEREEDEATVVVRAVPLEVFVPLCESESSEEMLGETNRIPTRDLRAEHKQENNTAT